MFTFEKWNLFRCESFLSIHSAQISLVGIFVSLHPHVLLHSSSLLLRQNPTKGSISFSLDSKETKKYLIRNYLPREGLLYRYFFINVVRQCPKKKAPRECPPPPVPKTSKTKTKTSAVGDWKRGPRVTALVVGHGVSEKAIETILARGYLSRIAVSASDCLSLDNPHFERSSSLALHLPSTIDKTELCPALVDENFDLGIGPIPSVDFLLRVQVLLSIALSLSLSID